MKHLGLIGSTHGSLPPTYWRIINDEVQLRYGRRHTAALTMHNLDAEGLDRWLRADDWPSLTETLARVVQTMPAAGVEGLVLCGSPLNPIALDLGRAANLPVISMGHAMKATLEMFRYRRVLVLGAKTSREDQMWRVELGEIASIDLTPAEREWFELIAEPDSGADPVGLQAETNRLISLCRKRGAAALVLADSSLSRWVNLEESHLPVFDAAELHGWAAAGWALADEGQMLSAPPCVVRGNEWPFDA